MIGHLFTRVTLVQLGLNNLASAVGLRLKSHGKRRTLKCLRHKRFTLSLAQR